MEHRITAATESGEQVTLGELAEYVQRMCDAGAPRDVTVGMIVGHSGDQRDGYDFLWGIHVSWKDPR